MQSVQKELCISFHICAVILLTPFIHLNCVCDGYFWCSVLPKVLERTLGAQYWAGNLNHEICRNSSVLFHLCCFINQSALWQHGTETNVSAGQFLQLWLLSPCKKMHHINIFSTISVIIHKSQPTELVLTSVFIENKTYTEIPDSLLHFRLTVKKNTGLCPTSASFMNTKTWPPLAAYFLSFAFIKLNTFFFHNSLHM